MRNVALVVLAISLSACGGGGDEYGDYSEASDAEARVAELESENEDLQASLEDANSEIEEAQAVAGESYDEMNEAIEGLETQEP